MVQNINDRYYSQITGKPTRLFGYFTGRLLPGESLSTSPDLADTENPRNSLSRFSSGLMDRRNVVKNTKGGMTRITSGPREEGISEGDSDPDNLDGVGVCQCKSSKKMAYVSYTDTTCVENHLEKEEIEK